MANQTHLEEAAADLVEAMRQHSYLRYMDERTLVDQLAHHLRLVLSRDVPSEDHVVLTNVSKSSHGLGKHDGVIDRRELDLIAAPISEFEERPELLPDSFVVEAKLHRRRGCPVEPDNGGLLDDPPRGDVSKLSRLITPTQDVRPAYSAGFAITFHKFPATLGQVQCCKLWNIFQGNRSEFVRHWVV